MLAVMLWGIVLAIGATVYGAKPNFLRGAIVAAVAFLFIGFWALMLRLHERSRRAK